MSGKANITLRLDAELLREARVLAARRGTSVSKLLSGRLEEMVRRDKAYEAARRRALGRLKKGYDLQWTRPSSRDELHEREPRLSVNSRRETRGTAAEAEWRRDE